MPLKTLLKQMQLKQTLLKQMPLKQTLLKQMPLKQKPLKQKPLKQMPLKEMPLKQMSLEPMPLPRFVLKLSAFRTIMSSKQSVLDPTPFEKMSLDRKSQHHFLLPMTFLHFFG